MKKRYSVKVNGKLFENVIDDMNSTSSWAIGGMIFRTKKIAKDFAKDLRKYLDEDEIIEVIEIYYE